MLLLFMNITQHVTLWSPTKHVDNVPKEHITRMRKMFQNCFQYDFSFTEVLSPNKACNAPS